MHCALPYLSSGTTKDMITSTRQLEHMTGESWTFDWRNLTLQCPHGVQVNHWFVMSSPPDFVRRSITARHGPQRDHRPLYLGN